MLPKKLPQEEFDSIYSRVPRVCVEVIIKTKNGIVLSKRDIPPYVGQWHIPGGTVRLGETLNQAVKRVAKEELGIVVKPTKFLGVIEYFGQNILGQPVGIAFLARFVSGKLRGSEQAEEVRFFKQIPQDTIPEQKIFLENYLRSSE